MIKVIKEPKAGHRQPEKLPYHRSRIAHPTVSGLGGRRVLHLFHERPVSVAERVQQKELAAKRPLTIVSADYPMLNMRMENLFETSERLPGQDEHLLAIVKDEAAGQMTYFYHIPKRRE